MDEQYKGKLIIYSLPNLKLTDLSDLNFELQFTLI